MIQLQRLIELQTELAEKLPYTKKRSLFSQINWSQKGLAITGPRGVGKTTLLLQHYKDVYNDPRKCLYVVGDDIDVVSLKLVEVADAFYKSGGKCLIIDEVHKYPNWSQELKNIYDRYPELQLIVSGSSTLEINKGKYDLSRRVVSYYLHGLSFREFVYFQLGVDFKSASLEDVVAKHVDLASQLKKELGDARVLDLFSSYLIYGHFPYYLEGLDTFKSKLNNSLNKVLYEDIPASFGLKIASVPSLQKLIALTAGPKPFMVDISRIASSVGISREYVGIYIDHLEKAGVLLGLRSALYGHASVRKPEKLYVNNPNLYLAINNDEVNQENIGMLREMFAANQLLVKYKVTSPGESDFRVDGFTFEVGGKSKLNKLGNYAEGTHFLIDDLEIGYNNIIPLYLLGFLY